MPVESLHRRAKTGRSVAHHKACSECPQGRTVISLFIGTKAQFIKMIPLIWELDARGTPYRVVNTGQHETISAALRTQYKVREPDSSLGKHRRDVNSLGRGLVWLAGNLAGYAIRGGRARRELFGGERGIVLVHGDTASTLLSTIIAKRAGQRVMHIEAGLRSWRLLNPFPEELIRIVVMRMSDYLIAPSPAAHDNLRTMSLKGRSWLVSANTGVDVVAADLSKAAPVPAAPDSPYCVVTIHRMETLYNRTRLTTVVEAVSRACEKLQVLFVQHGPTARRLKAYGLLGPLQRSGVRLLDLMDHVSFLHLMKDAEFIVTDGGSVQEEAGYLGVPCLLMRSATERGDGLEANVVLSGMDKAVIDAFIEDHRRYRCPPVDFERLRPSAEIVDILETLDD